MKPVAITLLLGIGLVLGGYWWGQTATNNAWQAKQAKADRVATEAIAQETQRADQAAASYLREHIEQEDRYADLTAQYLDLRRRAPLVVPGALVGVGACGVTQELPAPDLGVGAAPGVAGHDGPVLTLAAVRMWNGALTGVDAPAGACGAAGAAEGADAACAESAGLSLDDAWDNQATNARTCAEDRQRFQHLIDFLNRN